jgi:hypothetical protein
LMGGDGLHPSAEGRHASPNCSETRSCAITTGVPQRRSVHSGERRALHGRWASKRRTSFSARELAILPTLNVRLNRTYGTDA